MGGMVHFEWRNQPVTITIDGKTCHFKSIQEYTYARWLDIQKYCGEIDDWFYESRLFEFVERHRKRTQYTPDFEVVKKDNLGGKIREWHEVKMSLRQPDIRRFKYMAADYPDETMVLVLNYHSKSTKQRRLLGNAEKYVKEVIYAGPIFNKLGITGPGCYPIGQGE